VPPPTRSGDTRHPDEVLVDRAFGVCRVTINSPVVTTGRGHRPELRQSPSAGSQMR
jgi:hypothetical protein